MKKLISRPVYGPGRFVSWFRASRKWLATASAAWLIEQLAGFAFYSAFLGLILSYLGIRLGGSIMMVLQLFISTLLIWLYDQAHNDLFAIDKAKAYLHKKTRIAKWRPVTMPLSFLMLSCNCLPPVVLLCFRPEGVRGMSPRGLFVLMLAILTKTSYMTLIHLKVYHLYEISW